MPSENKTQKIVELCDLVYAPLQAVSQANIQLSSNIVDFLSATGDPRTDVLGKTTINLRTVQMLYEQLHNDAEDNAVVDSISLEVPLLSIYPLSTLKVSKSKVTFCAEVHGVQNINGYPKIIAELAGKTTGRSNNTPQISFEVELESVPVAEGLARFVDTLNTNALPKQLARRPLDENGNKLTGDHLQSYQQQMEYSQKERRMQKHLAEADDMLRIKNNELKLLTGFEYDEFILGESIGLQPDNVKETVRAIEEFAEIKRSVEHGLERMRTKQLKEKLCNTKEGAAYE